MIECVVQDVLSADEVCTWSVCCWRR